MNVNFLGENISLRPTNLSDAKKSAQWMNDSEVIKFLGISGVVTAVSRKIFLSKMLRSKNEKNFSIIEKKTGEYIGNIYIYNIHWKKRNAEVGIFIGEKRAWGKGYGTEAIELIKAYAFEDLNFCKLYLSTYEENVGAIKSYKKAGFIEKRKKENLLFFELIH